MPCRASSRRRRGQTEGSALRLDGAFGNDDGRTADGGEPEEAAAHGERELDQARPSHFMTLLDVEAVFALIERKRPYAQSAQRRNSGAGGGVLIDAQAWREHAGVELVGGIDGLVAEHKGRGAAAELESLVPGRLIDVAAADRIEIAHRNEGECV